MANLHIIRSLCERRKMTIRELAQRIDRDESSIQSAIRRGSTNTGTIEAIAKALEVPVGVFFDEKSDDTVKELQTEIKHLRELLIEKERLIEVLLEERKG